MSATRVEIDRNGHGVAVEVQGHPEARPATGPGMQVGGRRRWFRVSFWDVLLFGVCVGVTVASSEGIRVLVPTLGHKWYRTITPLYYVPFGRQLDFAFLFAVAFVAGVALVWEKLLRYALSVEPIPGGAKWYKSIETIMLLILATGLLVFDAALVLQGVSAMSWGKAKTTPEGLLFTGAYVFMMLCLSWLRVDSKRKALALVLLALPSISGCTLPEDETFRERQSEYVVTFVFDTSSSFDESVDRAWRFLEGSLQQLYRDRAGSNDDLVILARISGDMKSPLWIGSPRDLREQFSSAGDLRAFLREHAGDTGASRVHEAMISSMDRMMRNPNVKNGSAKSLLIVLSDMVATPGGASGADVVRVIERYAELKGAIGLFFVADGLDRAWDDKLTEIGIRHTVKPFDEVNPVMMSFE